MTPVRAIASLFVMSVGVFGSDGTTIQVVDRSGAPFPDVLVIVTSLDEGRELGRYLTGQEGRIRHVRFDDGLYRVIGVCPYDSCQTGIREFFGSAVGSNLTLTLTGAVNPETRIRVVDASGAPFPNVLVILSDASGGELARFLSAPDGTVPPVRLHNAEYRVTATCPYGICTDVVRSISGRPAPATLVLEMPMKSTDVHPAFLAAQRVLLCINVLEGEPTSVELLIRDTEAHRETWHSIPSDGRVDAGLRGDPAIMLLIRDKCITTYSLSRWCAGQSPFQPDSVPCLSTDRGEIHLSVPVCRR